MSLSSINPIFEGASAILYHFITPERFCDIINTNQFTPSAAEYNINGDGVNFMSFSRTGSFRHGWPICMQSEGGAGSEWGIVRLTIDGSMFNTHPNFKDANGIQSSIKVNPFDWAYHEHTKTGHRIKDTYDISIDADNGKEWMMASDDSMYGALPFNPGDYNYELEDRYAQPYSQAEDRLLTRAKHIPYADKYIKRVDIILMQIPNEEDYSDYQERQEEREAFYKAINNSRFKNITHLYDSVWSLEHGQEIPKEELLGNTSEVKPLYEYVCHLKGHRNSKGELAEWVIKSHETGEILSSHKSEQKAKEHLQQMHIFNEAAEGEEYCSHCGANVAGIKEYNGRKLCPSCLTQFKWLDEHRDPEDGTYEKYDLVPRETEDDEPDDEEYEAYKLNEFRSLLYRMANGYVKDINKFLQKYDISIELIDRETVENEELFDEDSHDLAMAFDGLRTDLRTTPIGLNEDRIYYYYVEEFNGSYMLFDEFMSDTLWHEAGHAICRRVGDILLLYDNLDVDEEEALVENFGIYMTSKTKNIENDYSRKLLSKFNGALAVLDAEQKGYYDDASLRKMLKFLRPRVKTEEELADILEENANIHKKQSASSIQDKKSDKLIGESTYGTDMDKRVQIFMEGVSQLGLSKNQVDAIDNITKVCLESDMFGNTENGEYDNPENGEYNPENDNPENDYNPETDENPGVEDNEYAHELTMDEMYDKLIEQGISKETINIVTDIIGWNPDSMLKILDAATGYKSFDQLPEF